MAKKENNRNSDQTRQNRMSLLSLLRKNIVMRAALVGITVVLTLILLFSLTVAWLTNVTQTGGLTFTAEKWDFDGTITLGEGAVTAAPGDEGFVSMQITNNGARMVAASVTVSKESMDEAMQKRLYFYVDTPTVRNGEYMDRVWVSANRSYTYTILPQSDLTINESTQNAPALKWMWVYDVLGYYVKGTSVTGQSGNTGVKVQEYIAPIEYEYDQIHTTFDANGTMTMIDDSTSVRDFLRELTKNDGYDGIVDTTVQPTTDGYYPIDVDENGNGIWIYLCTYSEIVANTAYDEQLGNEMVSCNAKITVTGQNSRMEALEVTSEEALLEALNSPLTGAVALSNDIILTDSIELSASTNAMIDLNGHTLSSDAESVFTTEPGARLTLTNGTVEGGENTVAGVEANGAYVLLSNVTITGVDEGITVFDHQNELGADSSVHITNSTIIGHEDGLWIYGNGDASERDTSIVIENSTITGESYTGIICNGSTWGTDIIITDSTVSGYYAGIYHPQKESTMLLEGCTISGIVGVVAKGGKINIVDCTISGTGDYNEPAYVASGWSDTGDGVYLEAGYAWTTEITISGDKTVITAADTESGSLAVRKYMADATNGSITISGGLFNTDVSDYLAEGATCTESENGYVVTTAETAE